MANIILLIILLLGIYSGARRGLILQAILTVGYIVTWIIALMFHKQVAIVVKNIIPFPSNATTDQLFLYNLSTTLHIDDTFYNGVSFVLILLLGWLVTRLIALTLNRLTHIPIINQVNTLSGAGLGFLCNWIGLYVILTILSLVPFASVQDIFTGHSLATIIVKHTPIISEWIIKLWSQVQ